MSVQCANCGQEWERDPALEVPCPKCDAKVGHYCLRRRPSGHTANFGQKDLIHPERDGLALDLGLITKCPRSTKQHEDNNDTDECADQFALSFET